MKISIWLVFLLFFSISTAAQEGFVATKGNFRLHYRIVGQGPDTLVVPDGGWQFPYYEVNSKGLVCIIYDCRNRGYSDSNPSIGLGYDVDDLEVIRRFFKIRKMNIAGWSYLGGVVALYASKYPQHTRSVIQVGPIPLKKGEYFDSYLKSTMERRSTALDLELADLKIAGKDKNDPESYCRKFYEASLYSILSDRNKAQDLAVNVPCNCPNERPDTVGALIKKIFADLKDWDWSSQFTRMQTPTLIIHGIDDNIPIGSSEAWAAINNKSRLLTFNSSGHMPFAEEPERFFKSIKDFISDKEIK